MKNPLLLFFLLIAGQIQSQDAQPKIWLPHLFEKLTHVRDFTMSPDGKLVFCTLQTPSKEFSAIGFTRQTETGWSEIRIASFSGQFKDLEPFFAPDGKRLYFASNRPLEKNSQAVKDFDIWYTDWEPAAFQWTEPVNMGAPINSKEDEFYPAVTASKNVFFTRMSEDASQKEDIFISVWSDGNYLPPDPLPDAINGPTYEFNAYVAPDESFILFTSYGREDDLGGGDLYLSKKGSDGKWTRAQHLGKSINSPKLDFCPYYDASGQSLYFSSNRNHLPPSFELPLDLDGFLKISQEGENGNSKIYVVPFSIP